MLLGARAPAERWVPPTGAAPRVCAWEGRERACKVTPVSQDGTMSGPGSVPGSGRGRAKARGQAMLLSEALKEDHPEGAGARPRGLPRLVRLSGLFQMETLGGF